MPKPGKDDYSVAKAYWVVSLLNCLGKMVEKVAAMLVSAHCEARSAFHPVQYGCQTQRSDVDPNVPQKRTDKPREIQKKKVDIGRLALRPSFLHHANPTLCRG